MRNRAKLRSLYIDLAWLRNDAVACCRKQCAYDGSSASGFDLNTRLTGMRSDEDHAAAMPQRAQRSMLQCVSVGYKRMLKNGAGWPRYKREVRSFELHGSKSRRASKGWTAQVNGVGKIRSKGCIPEGESKNARIVKGPLGTGYDVQLVQVPDGEAADGRDVVGIDPGVEAPCSLFNGAQNAPVKKSDREKKSTRELLIAPSASPRAVPRRRWRILQAGHFACASVGRRIAAATRASGA